MSKRMPLYVLALCLGLSLPGRADFKYTETSQVTGGAMASAVKVLGIFSKSARQITKPTETTTYVKGNHLRRDNADGSYQIIDLDGQQIIQVDPAQQTYSAYTFQQMRDAVAKMEAGMNNAMKRESHEKGQNVKITPKIEINPTGKSQVILGQNSQEVNMKVEMIVQSTDSQQQTQSGAFSTDMDSWVATSVAGYGEVRNFYKRMAQEINWNPNFTFGTDPRMMKSMVDLYKSGKIPTGLPMLSTVSMAASGQPAAQGSQQQEPEKQSSSTSSDMTNPSAAAAKALGGMFGGFGHRHKKQKEENAEAPAAPAPPGSLLTMTLRVTSFSTDPVDSSRFQVPAGYTRVQSNIERMLQGSH